MQVVYSSMALVMLTVIYDELHAHSSHWVVRNLVNALGFASFESGSSLVASKQQPRDIDLLGRNADYS